MLESLAAHGDGFGVRDVSQEVGVDKSTVSRLFDQLRDAGYANQDAASGRFHVGPSLYSLAATVHSRDTLWQAAQPIVHELATAFNETCYLTKRDDDAIVFREKGDCKLFTCPAERLDVRRVPKIAGAVVGASRRLSLRLAYRPDVPIA